MAEDALLALDLGTTFLKAVLFDLKGNVLAKSSREIPLYRPYPTWAEQNPEDWWNLACEATRSVVKNIPDGFSIAAIGLSSFRESVVPINSQGRKTADCILWMDKRAVDEVEELREAIGAEEIHKRTGMIPAPNFTAPQLLWLKHHSPETLIGADFFLSPRDYLAYRLTGEFITDYSLASRTMLYEVGGRWWEDLCSYVGVRPSQFPPVRYSDEVVGRLKRSASSHLDLPKDIPVVAGAGDRACEGIGTSAIGGRAMISTGTATNVSTCVGAVPVPMDTRVIYSQHALRDQWLVEQGISSTGSILKWFADLLQLDEESRFEELASEAGSSPVGSRGLLLLPFFSGARSTRWNQEARGVLLGLTLDHRRGDIVRAILEGVAYEVRACVEILVENATDPSEMIFVGGGARSQVWAQIMADVLARPVQIPAQTEGAAFGASLLAGVGVGLFGNVATAARELAAYSEQVEPDSSRSSQYSTIYASYNHLYQRLAPMFTEMAQLHLGLSELT